MNPNPKRAALGLLAILAAGCPPCGLIPCIDELPPREDVEEVEEPAPCLSLVNEVFPEPGDAAVYYRSSVVVSFGAMGLSPDTPLADLWINARALRLADGPDEVHLRSVARHELAQARSRMGASSAWFTTPEQLLAPPRIR